MARAFFPEPAFAWVFCLGICLLTSIAAWTDTRTAKIPNRLNVLIFALGLLMNLIRAAWLGSQDKPLWVFDTGSLWLGALDGLLFAVTGFLVAFAAMFVCWIMGLCGGGDVKLLAAVGAWTGLHKSLLAIWFVSVIVLFIWFGARILSGGLRPRAVTKTLNQVKKQNRPGAPEAAVPTKLRVTYSLPIAVATALVLFWMFRFELQIAEPKPQPQGIAHVRPQPSTY